ncbi:hypothetical protein JXA12_05515 [Candidatus Woesearchaeota archaeon]|nr:hypothetical protein [Candidatus Woesearchaeota archaeon]
MDWQALRQRALKDTKRAVATSVDDDNLITQAISAMEDVDRAANTLTRRLREWYELYSPEFSKAVDDNEAFVRRVLEKPREEQLRELGLHETMGADLERADVQESERLAKAIKALREERDQLESYLDRVMLRRCPNVLVLAGPTIGARLLREAGSLKRLAMVQASTIQLYGAEKALFRHLKTGAKPPKHGHLINHPLLAKAGKEDKGKVARALADKISIAAKVDYFKGEPIGETLKQQLEARFG